MKDALFVRLKDALFVRVGVQPVTLQNGDKAWDVIGELFPEDTNDNRQVGLCRCDSAFAAFIMRDWWAAQTHTIDLTKEQP